MLLQCMKRLVHDEGYLSSPGPLIICNYHMYVREGSSCGIRRTGSAQLSGSSVNHSIRSCGQSGLARREEGKSAGPLSLDRIQARQARQAHP